MTAPLCVESESTAITPLNCIRVGHWRRKNTEDGRPPLREFTGAWGECGEVRLILKLRIGGAGAVRIWQNTSGDAMRIHVSGFGGWMGMGTTRPPAAQHCSKALGGGIFNIALTNSRPAST
jgi:hypothetical protein